MQHASIPTSNSVILHNLANLGIPVVNDAMGGAGGAGVKKKYRHPDRRNRIDENTFKHSRWTPYVKDIMEASSFHLLILLGCLKLVIRN